MPSCVLRYCKNSSSNASKAGGVTFHKFPQPGHEKRGAWIKYVQKNRSEDTWLPSDYSRICSMHFKEDDKYATKTGRTYLRKTAVPCDDPEQESYAEVELLDIKEEKIEQMPRVKMEIDTSNEDAQTSSSVASTEVFQEPLPIKLEIFDETEKDNSAVPFTTSIPTGTKAVHEPLRIKLEVLDETETDGSDSSAVHFTTSIPSGSNSTTNMPDSQVTNPLPAIPGIAGQAEEVELWTLDEYDKFGLSIAKSMKNLSDVEQRIKLIAAIENLVAEYVTKDVKKTFPNTSFASETAQSSKSFDPAYATFAFQNKDNSYTLVCKRKAKSQNK